MQRMYGSCGIRHAGVAEMSSFPMGFYTVRRTDLNLRLHLSMLSSDLHILPSYLLPLVVTQLENMAIDESHLGGILFPRCKGNSQRNWKNFVDF